MKLKREHNRWGANRVLIELRKDPVLADLPLPSRSRFYQYFRQHCPDCLSVWTKHIKVPVPVVAKAVHVVWQLDLQEGHRLADESIATVCGIRDPYGAAMIASQAFSVRRPLGQDVTIYIYPVQHAFLRFLNQAILVGGKPLDSCYVAQVPKERPISR